jgi:hypothetical protein
MDEISVKNYKLQMKGEAYFFESPLYVCSNIRATIMKFSSSKLIKILTTLKHSFRAEDQAPICYGLVKYFNSL